MNNLTGKVALVTGSARGIGRGIALALAKQGASLVLNDRFMSDDLRAAGTELKEIGTPFLLCPADAGNEAEVKKLFIEIIAKFGRLDILVNNAGTSQPKDIFEIELEDWERIINNNLTSCFLCSKQAMKIMKDQNYGRIINISSVVGHQGALFGHIHYAATKSGQLGLTKTLARTGAKYNITVNAVAPGIINTRLLLEVHGEEGIKKLSDSIPLGLGSIEDVAHAVVFLSGDHARYITGATIDVNGGIYLR